MKTLREFKNNPSTREWGTSTSTEIFKQDTPGEKKKNNTEKGNTLNINHHQHQQP